MRKVIPFNDGWLFAKPGQEPAPVSLPHTWNAIDGQDGGDDYWRGTAVYTKRFEKPGYVRGERVFLSFEGAAMTTEVELNGQTVCRHEGGYSTFRADITDHLKDKNELTVRTDNSRNDRVYPQMADFTFYGGLYRGVKLIIVPEVHFELVEDGTPGIRVATQIEGTSASVTVETWQNADVPVTITVNGEQKEAISENGRAKAVFTIENAHLWNGLADPFLYTARAQLASGDTVSTRFGIRTFAVDPEKGFFLNGQSYPLRGVCRHQDRAVLGNALTEEQFREDMDIIRELGANTLRLAHYQHAQEFYDLCDENGLIVWAEIPYISNHMPGGRANTISQMRELVTQCRNHPSIVCWGLSNEITMGGDMTDDMLENHRLLNDLCHRLDPTRPTTMAHLGNLDTASPLIGIADLGSYNLYFGWYYGETRQTGEFLDKYHAEHPDRAMGMSEYGADANTQFHSAKPERGDYTEEYQCLYHEQLLRCIEERPYLWATHVWNLFDFAADARNEGGRKGVNQKGLVTMDRRIRKDAFYVYKSAWSREPFVHLCGRRYAERTEDETEIKVYSNLEEVTLFVDGRRIGTLSGNRIFTWHVPITGTHTVTAKADTVSDTMVISHVKKANKAYVYERRNVTNWFDPNETDPDCFSIKDALGDLLAHPEAAAILKEAIPRLRTGEVPKMVAGRPLDGYLQRMGDDISAQQAKDLNAALQKIRRVSR